MLFVLASAIVAFRGWPQVADQPATAAVTVPASAAATNARYAVRLTAALAGPTARTVAAVRRSVSRARGNSAGTRTGSATGGSAHGSHVRDRRPLGTGSDGRSQLLGRRLHGQLLHDSGVGGHGRRQHRGADSLERRLVGLLGGHRRRGHGCRRRQRHEPAGGRVGARRGERRRQRRLRDKRHRGGRRDDRRQRPRRAVSSRLTLPARRARGRSSGG